MDTFNEIYQTKPTELSELQEHRMQKLNALADALDTVKVLDDGSLYLKTKGHLIIESTGHQIMYSESGEIVIKAKSLHLNPSTDFSDIQNSDEIVKIISDEVIDN